MTEHKLTRRGLLQGAGATLGAAHLHAASSLLPFALPEAIAPGQRRYSVQHAAEQQEHGIAYDVWSGRQWVRRQFLPTPGASNLAVSHNESTLFAALDARSTGSPAGEIHAFCIDGGTGMLRAQASQPLALSARKPLGMALSPQGDFLVVIAADGVLSLLPLSASGQLQPVVAAHKHLALSRLGTAPIDAHFTGGSALQVEAGTLRVSFRCSHDGLQAGPVAALAAALVSSDVAESRGTGRCMQRVMLGRIGPAPSTA